MKKLINLSISCLACILVMSGCNGNVAKSPKIAAKIDGSVLVLDADSTQTHNVNISVGQLASFSTSIRGGEEFNLMDSLKLQKSAHYELAYALAQNDGLMDAHISILNKLDTTLQCQFKYSDIWEHKGEITSGKFAKIVNTFDSEHIDSELRRWVYKNKKINIGDTLFNAMRLYLRELSMTTNTEFTISGEIPSMKSSTLKGNTYKVSSDIQADNYFLFAGDSDEDIDYFIEEMIARNMVDAAKNLSSPLYCFIRNNEWGVQCIFLIGINNDWSSQVIPMGVISIDDVAPEYGMLAKLYDESYTNYNFNKRGFSVNVSTHPQVSGKWDASFGNFQGWSPYNVPWTFTWSGDVAKIVVHRSKSLTETISLKGKTSPYHITISTYLPNTGDNYVKLEAYDSLGNKSETDINIALERVKDDKPQIDIDNNIWN